MDLIRSGEYYGILQEFQPLLQIWWKKFEGLDCTSMLCIIETWLTGSTVPKYPRIILSIEFEYARKFILTHESNTTANEPKGVYMNSLALQAVLDQWTSNVSQAQTQQLSSLYWNNEVYVKEVVSASRNLLRQVVEGLLPDDYLKHVPVRTFFRVLSGAMFLLKVRIAAARVNQTKLTKPKTFALGAKENEVKTSLDLLDRTIEALRTSVVDDVHLCLRIADLLEGLTTSVRHKFVRLAGRKTQQDTTPSSDSIRTPYHQAQRPEAM